MESQQFLIAGVYMADWDTIRGGLFFGILKSFFIDALN